MQSAVRRIALSHKTHLCNLAEQKKYGNRCRTIFILVRRTTSENRPWCCAASPRRSSTPWRRCTVSTRRASGAPAPARRCAGLPPPGKDLLKSQSQKWQQRGKIPQPVNCAAQRTMYICCGPAVGGTTGGPCPRIPPSDAQVCGSHLCLSSLATDIGTQRSRYPALHTRWVVTQQNRSGIINIFFCADLHVPSIHP